MSLDNGETAVEKPEEKANETDIGETASGEVASDEMASSEMVSGETAGETIDQIPAEVPEEPQINADDEEPDDQS